MKKTLRINPADNVLVALRDLRKGTALPGGGKTLQQIPAGHKIADAAIPAGKPVIKYGDPIGIASKSIRAGAWIHSHNLKTGLSGKKAYRYAGPVRAVKHDGAETFMGYRRADGRTGTRNEIWVIPTVHCINRVTEKIAAEAAAKYKTTRHFDGVWAFPHPFGCSQLGYDLENTRNILRALVKHPNAGGVLILSLGCENNDPETFLKGLGKFDRRRIKHIRMQDMADEAAAARKALAQIHTLVKKDRRTARPVSELAVGVKCGGSDAFSGVTANPLIGRISDKLAACGGTVLMGEVPEMFGAEHLLMARAKNRTVFDKTVGLVNGFKDYYTDRGFAVYENPSPGNKKGGITTLEEKSLGCTQKSGAAAVCGVLPYGVPGKNAGGLHLVGCPGNDGVSTTALTAAGAACILFSTGRGTPLGAPVPTMKIATTSRLAGAKPGWIDFNAGPLLTGTPADELTGTLWQRILDTCSGKVHTRNELNGLKEISLFKDGVTL